MVGAADNSNFGWPNLTQTVKGDHGVHLDGRGEDLGFV